MSNNFHVGQMITWDYNGYTVCLWDAESWRFSIQHYKNHLGLSDVMTIREIRDVPPEQNAGSVHSQLVKIEGSEVEFSGAWFKQYLSNGFTLDAITD